MLYKVALICLLCAAIAHSFSIGGYTCEYKLGAAYPLGLLRRVRICRPTETATTSLLLNRIFNNAIENSQESEEAQAINNYGALSQFRSAHDDRRFYENNWRPTPYEPVSTDAKINAELGVALGTIKSDIHAIRESMSFMDLITQKVFGFPERQPVKAEKPHAEQNEIMSKLEQFERQIEHLTRELHDMRSEVNAQTPTTPTAVVDSDEVSEENDEGIRAEDETTELERKWREIMDSIRMDNEEIGDMIITRHPGNVDAVEDQENDGDDDTNDNNDDNNDDIDDNNDANDDNDDNEDTDIMTTASPYTFYETENANAYGDEDANDDNDNYNGDEALRDVLENHRYDIVGSSNQEPEQEPEPETDGNDYDMDDNNDEYDGW